MKLVIQRVTEAKVYAGEEKKLVGQIGKGLFVLVGFKKGDSKKDVEFFAQKLSKLRVMSDSEGKMNLSVKEAGGAFLVVSQFTLLADTAGGNRPSFIDSEDPIKAKELYDLFIELLRLSGVEVQTGKFRNYMEITPILDGPVTIIF